MDDTTKYMFEWSYHFIKNKDIITKKIEEIQEHINNNFIFVKQKDKNIIYYIAPFIEDIKTILNDIEKYKKDTDSTDSCIITLNTSNNLKITIENWSLLDKDPKLQLIFTNPFSNLDKRWMVFPYTHSKFTDPEALESGLKSLFAGVEPTNKEDFERKVKLSSK